jgi:hypothetical protein
MATSTFSSVKAPELQADLFESVSKRLSVDFDFSAAKRTALDATSWIEVVPGWMTGSKILLERLIAVVPFQQHDRRLFDQMFQEPRLTAAYGDIADAPEEALREAARALSLRYGVNYDGLWLNLYRGGTDSTGWHRDRHACRRAECIVPVLTLGATRRFQIKPRRGGRSIAYKPGSGDLIVMGGRCQEDWMHGVPKDPAVAGTRISVNFQSSTQS